MDPVAISTFAALAGAVVLFATGTLVPRGHPWGDPMPPLSEPEPVHDGPIDLEAARARNRQRCDAIARHKRAAEQHAVHARQADVDGDYDRVDVMEGAYAEPVMTLRRCNRCGFDPDGGRPKPPHVVLYDDATLTYLLTVPATDEVVLETMSESLAYETQDVLESGA